MRPTAWQGKVTSLFSAILAGMCLIAASSYAGDKADISQPLAGLSTQQLGMYEAGLEEFERRFRSQDGLGPQFNGNSCHTCHRKPSVGGSGARYRSNFNFAHGNDLLELEGGPLLQEKPSVTNQENLFQPQQQTSRCASLLRCTAWAWRRPFQTVK